MPLHIFLLCYLFISNSFANDDALSQQIYRYIFANEEICGDPFVNPDWLPAIDDCVIGCEERRFICLMHTENKQQKCQSSLAREFDWPDEERAIDANVEQFQKDMLQIGTGTVVETVERHVDSTTIQPGSRSILESIIKSGYGENPIYEPESTASGIVADEPIPPETTPETTIITITTEGTTPSTRPTARTTYLSPWKSEDSSMDPLVMGYEYPIQPSYGETQLEVEPSTNPTSEVTRTSLLSSVMIETTTKYSLEYTPSYFSLRIQSSEARETTPIPVATSDNYDYSSTGSRIDLVPPPPPPDPVAMDSVDERYLSRMIKQFSIAGPHTTPESETPTGLKDRSRRCCEWALNGLCDRTWQKVRTMCPKSCGVISCEDVDGITSCNRIPDIDVEECYQSLKKKARVHAAPVYVPVTVRRKSVTLKPSTAVIKSTSKKHKKKKRSKKHRKL